MAILRKRKFFSYQQREEERNAEKAGRPAPRPEPVRAPQAIEPAATPGFLREEELRTSLSADAVVTGKLSFTQPTRIDGKLKGEIRCTDLLVIGATAVVEGSVRAGTVRIEGSVRGDILETHRVIVRSGGRFVGRIESDLLVLEDGGHLEAHCGPASEETLRQGAARG